MTTAFHCDKLCGNACCNWLRARLIEAKLRDEGLDVDGNAAYRRKLLIERGHDAATVEASAANCAIVDAELADPAKLAELYVLALRAMGFDVACDWSDRHDFYVAWWPNDPKYADGTQWIHVRAGRYGRFKNLITQELTMPQARTKLRAIMQTTADKSSCAMCEAILRGAA